MNFALDAIWWELKHKKVRDLAALLLSPPLWETGCELSVRQLLGEHGFRHLLNLDKDPSMLTSWLDHFTTTPSLEVYAYRLMKFWSYYLKKFQLNYKQLHICSQLEGLENSDVLLNINGQFILLTFLGQCCLSNNRNLNVSLEIEQGKKDVKKKFISPYGIPVQFQKIPMTFADDCSTNSRKFSIVRGMLFTQGNTKQNPEFSTTWTGKYYFSSEWKPATNPNYLWCNLSKIEWLSPVRTKNVYQAKVIYQSLVPNQVYLFAECECHLDGYWHEVSRVLILS